MKAISLLQPWASAISVGLKLVETRSWVTHWRGPIAIHASKALKPDQRDAFMHKPEEDKQFFHRAGILDSTFLPLGSVVCTAELIDCIEFDEDTVPTFSHREQRWGNFEYGRYGLILRNVKPLLSPVPARGELGLWEWRGTPQ